MKVYPKIPHYDYPVVHEPLLKAGDLALLEKFAGSGFRFALYDDRYAEVSPDQVASAADGDGWVLAGGTSRDRSVTAWRATIDQSGVLRSITTDPPGSQS
jgi:hypothetical protein